MIRRLLRNDKARYSWMCYFRKSSAMEYPNFNEDLLIILDGLREAGLEKRWLLKLQVKEKNRKRDKVHQLHMNDDIIDPKTKLYNSSLKITSTVQ